jgi:hypothetical protein
MLLSQSFGRIQVHFEENAWIDDVLYVPDLQANLLSTGQLAEGASRAYLAQKEHIYAATARCWRMPGWSEGITSFTHRASTGR